ncbi:MAG: bacteriohemerythrin [Actinomycetota bacterium]|jgi:hemerythrin|nr:bacteriohemerythrin [Actinomycetota bacterium]
MSHIEWDPALATGHQEIDAQHASLFALANALDDAISAGVSDANAVADAIYGLTDYVVEHFADEEALMRQVGFPGASAHHSLHQHLTAETMRLATRYFNGEDLVASQITPFVVDWLRTHIQTEDMGLVGYIHEHELG